MLLALPHGEERGGVTASTGQSVGKERADGCEPSAGGGRRDGRKERASACSGDGGAAGNRGGTGRGGGVAMFGRAGGRCRTVCAHLQERRVMAGA